jgi:hypothetical protein
MNIDPKAKEINVCKLCGYVGITGYSEFCSKGKNGVHEFEMFIKETDKNDEGFTISGEIDLEDNHPDCGCQSLVISTEDGKEEYLSDLLEVNGFIGEKVQITVKKVDRNG